jgi:hypothetical protein
LDAIARVAGQGISAIAIAPIHSDVDQAVMQIISVPTVFTCKTPTAGWLNLAQIRQLQFDNYPNPVAVVTWHNGDKESFFGENAIAILQSWEEAQERCECNYRVKNRRT